MKILSDPVRELRLVTQGWAKARSTWTVLVVCALIGAGDHVKAATPAFPLHTSGRFIVDSNGTRVYLNGVNWYGAESTDYVVAGLQTASLQSIVQEIKSLAGNGTAMMTSPGGSVATTIAVVAGNGFTGTVNLACTVSSPTGGGGTPTCSVPATVSVTSNAAVNVTVTLMTTAGN